MRTPNEKYAHFIKERCNLLGIKYKDAKKALGFSRGHIFEIIGGRMTLQGEKLLAFATLLETSVEVLLCLQYDIPHIPEETTKDEIENALQTSNNFSDLKKILSKSPDPSTGIHLAKIKKMLDGAKDVGFTREEIEKALDLTFDRN